MNNLLAFGCGVCTQLVHAWRPPDGVAATAAMLATLGIGAFCNGNMLSDSDPIRRTCSGTTPATGDDVCEADGTLGLVLPIFIPGGTTPPTTITDLYPNLNPPPFMCSVGAFDLESTGSAALPCPGGPQFLGKCFQPFLNLPTGEDFECLTTKSARAFATPTGTDGRVWNLQIKVPDLTHVPPRPAEYVKVGAVFMTSAYFRDQAVVAGGAVGCTAGPGGEDPQIGCLVTADSCSLGAAGPAAATASNQILF